MSSNPFSLETDKKKFFTEVVAAQNDQKQDNLAQILSGTSNANRIKNMNQELQNLAKKRQQMLFKQEQMNYIFKKQKPSSSPNFEHVNPQNDKKIQSSSPSKMYILKFIQKKSNLSTSSSTKKKQIYLANMNINIKKEQTKKLAESIRDQEETLKARQLYFQNDVEFMQKFILGIKKQADDAQNAVESELKHQEQLVSRMNGLQAEIQKMDNLISKNNEILESLQLYKNFIERFYDDKNKNWKQYSPKVTAEDILFMTEGGANLPKDNDDGMGFVIQYEPHNMLQIFVDAEELNIREIQNLQDKQQELDNVANIQKQERALLEAVIAENQERLKHLQKKCAKKQLQHDQFKVMARSNTNKINILEDQNLDIEKLCQKLFQIYQQINPKRSEQLQVSDKVGEMKREAAELQQDIQKIKISILHSKQNYPHLIEHVEKDFKNKIKRQNLQKKQEENRKLELKKQQEQEKKRNQINNTKTKGRKDMEKIILKKKAKKEKKDDGDKGDDDLKYLQAEL